MIGIVDDDGKTRLPVAFNGVALNTLTLSSAGVRSYKYGNEVVVSAPRTAMDYVSEPNQWADGMELYGLRKSSRIIVIRGITHGRDVSELYDNVRDLAKATDPARIRFQNPTDPFLALTFSTPTRDTSNFANGLAACKYVGIPLRMVEPALSIAGQGLSAQWQLDFLLKEPKRFLQTASTLSGAGTAANSIADDRSWPVLTFTLSGGAGASNFTIQNVGSYGGTRSIVLNLSSYNSGNWTVNFRDRTIYQGTTLKTDVFASGDWFEIEPNNNVITYANTTNTSSRVLTWYPAFTL